MMGRGRPSSAQPPGARGRAGRSRRPARRSCAYQSKLAQAGDSSTASPARARPARRLDRVVHRPGPVTGTRARRRANASATSSAASPMATTARTCVATSASGREVEALVAAAGDQHDVVEAADGRGRGVRRRGLRVVVPLDPADAGHQLDPVRGAAERRPGRRRRPSTVATPASSTPAAAARALVRSWGRRAAQVGHARQRALGPDGAGAVDAVVGRRSPKVTWRPGRDGEPGHDDRVVGVADGRVVRPLVVPDAGLGRLVAAMRAVPVEVVGGEVEPHRGLGRKRSVKARRKVEHSTTNTSTSRSMASTSGTSVLPAATARRPLASSMAVASRVVVVLPSVPVTATIGRGRRHGPAPTRRPGRTRCAPARRRRRPPRTAGGARARPGLGAPARRRPTSAASVAPVGASTRSTPSSAAARGVAVGDPVVGHRDPPAAGHQRPGGGLAGDGQAVDERGRQVTPRRSAGEVGVEEAEGDRGADAGEDPEADDDRRLGPADELEVVVDRRHAEDPPR